MNPAKSSPVRTIQPLRTMACPAAVLISKSSKDRRPPSSSSTLSASPASAAANSASRSNAALSAVRPSTAAKPLALCWPRGCSRLGQYPSSLRRSTTARSGLGSRPVRSTREPQRYQTNPYRFASGIHRRDGSAAMNYVASPVGQTRGRERGAAPSMELPRRSSFNRHRSAGLAPQPERTISCSPAARGRRRWPPCSACRRRTACLP